MDPDLKEFLLSHSLEGVVVTDLSGDITHWNETARSILGLPEGFLEGRHVSAIFPAASASHLLPNILLLARETRGFDGEIMLQDSRGTPVIVRLSVQCWPGKEPHRFVFRFIDWREAHEIQRQLRESSQLAVLGNLTRSLSHEILNPIAVIGTYSRRLIEAGSAESGSEEWARQVLAAVSRLEDMIETLRTYLDMPSPSFVEESMDEVMDRSVRNIQGQADSKGILINNRKSQPLPRGFIDPELLETAFTAALVNAIERMPDGGELTVWREPAEEQGTVLIRDTGPSLDIGQIEEDLSPVHVIGGERFHLNLAISRRIVEGHGGRFILESTARQGLTVRIALPTDRRAVARTREL